MRSDLGEIFVDGGLVSLSNTSIEDLSDMVKKLEVKNKELHEKLEKTIVEIQEQ